MKCLSVNCYLEGLFLTMGLILLFAFVYINWDNWFKKKKEQEK